MTRRSKNQPGLQTAVAMAVLMALSLPSRAQTSATDPTAETQRVTITGSNIKRIDAESTSPVQVITREDLVRTGQTEITNVLRQLTAAGSGGVSNFDGSGSFSVGASSVSFRGLGSQATLVLLNGRRIAPFAPADPNYGQASFVNLDSLPFEVIDRVEVLKDGASAIYGSDAIAGVINIITRGEFTGGLVGLTASANTRGHYPESSADLTYGFGNLAKDGFNLFASLELTHRGATSFDEESSWLIDKRFTANPNYRTGDKLYSTYAGNYYAAVYDEASLGSAFYYEFLEPRGDCPADQLDSRGRCRFNIWPYSDLEAASDRVNLLSIGSLVLGQDHTAYYELLYNRTKTRYRSAPQVWGDIGSWFAAGTGQIVNVPEVLPADHPNNPYGEPVGYRHRFAEVGPRNTEILMQSTRMVLGVRGLAAGWDYDTALTWSENRFNSTEHNQISRTKLTEGIVNGTYDFLDPAAGALSPDDLRLTPRDSARSSFVMADLKGSREIGTLPGGPIGLALGTELRRESRKATPDADKLSGEVLGFGAASAEGSRTVATVYSELRLPVTKSLELQAAARWDHYSDYGNSFNPKLGMYWKADPTLAVRGSVQTGFRAPSLTEIAKSDVSAFTTILDPKRCVDGTEDDCFGTGVGILIRANPNLSPEKSKGFNLGIVWEPSPVLSMTMDLWKIRRRNEVDTLSVQEIVDNEDSTDPRYVGRVVRGPADPNNPDVPGPIQTVTTGYFNLGRTETSGLDLTARLTQSVGEYGKVVVGADVSYTINLKKQSTSTSANANYLGFNQYPRWKSNFSVGWEYGNFVTTVSADVTSGYKTYDPPEIDSSGAEDCQDPDGTYAGICRVPMWAVYGLSVAYKGFKDLDLSLVVRNLGDRKPPVDPYWYSLPAFNADAHSGSGRTFTLAAKYKF